MSSNKVQSSIYFEQGLKENCLQHICISEHKNNITVYYRQGPVYQRTDFFSLNCHSIHSFEPYQYIFPKYHLKTFTLKSVHIDGQKQLKKCLEHLYFCHLLYATFLWNLKIKSSYSPFNIHMQTFWLTRFDKQ